VRHAVLVAVVLVAGCGGGSTDGPDEPRPAPPGGGRLGFAPDLRTADARSPFVPAGEGAWRCATDGRLQLTVSEQGEVAASIGERVLVSVSTARALVNRACDRTRSRGGIATSPPGGQLGAAVVRCTVPPEVVVDFGGGDVTVRAPGGRLLAAAAVRPDRVGVAAYWGRGCAPA
jgi:hypothetical protein